MELAHTVRPAAALAALELLVVSGRDREKLVHGLATGEVRKLASGAFAHGFFTSGQGRILADYRLLAIDDAFWLLVPDAAALAAHLEKYRLASEVELIPRRDLPVHVLRGPGAAAFAATAPRELLALPDPASRSEAVLVLSRSAEGSNDPEAWLKGAAQAGEVDFDAVAAERWRVEAGDLVHGVDFGTENLPQEIGREHAVSYNKGCFLGQEVVARIHYRGGVQKKPCGIRFDGAAPPAAGVELHFEGRPAGRATSVALSPRFGAIGLGILHQRAATPGTALELEGGSARVVALPFESP